MPSSDEQPEIVSLLLKAIKKESLFRLVELLRDIIEHSPESRQIASKWLLTAKDDVKSEPVSTSPITSVKEESISEPTASVSMTPRFEECLYCLERYDVTQNSATSCRYHVDLDTMDEEFFKNEIIAGIDVDNEEYREAWPEKFFYLCCGRDLLDEECQVGWHKRADRPSKRVIPIEVRCT